MKQPASHKDIDFGQTLFTVILLQNKAGVLISRKEVAAIEKEEWEAHDHTTFKYSDTFYRRADAVEYAASLMGVNVTVK